MDLVERLPRFARLEFLGKYQAPGRLVAAGFVAGFVLFLGWWAFQPPLGVRAGTAAAAASGQSADPAIGDGSGVLDGITGAPEPGRDSADISIGDADALGTDPDLVAGETPALDADGNPIAPDSVATDGFAGDPGVSAEGAPPSDAQAPPADAVTLVPYYVEVERGPGVSEVLRIDAVSPEQALGILRDYRGNPHVLRGPSTQPLD
jgi:hypothetical protein